MNEHETTVQFAAEDIEKNKVMAALAYFIFFLPLITCPDSPFGKFHANQGLVLLLTSIAGSIVLSIIPIIGWILLPLFGLAVFIFGVIGLVGALNGGSKKLPVIGKFVIIK